MKNTLLFALCLFAAATVVAQTKIKSTDIIKKINAGEPVEYKNAEIEGDLDLTNLENRRLEHSSGNWNNGNDTYESNVEVSLKFTDCTFLGNVLVYYSYERSNETLWLISQKT